MNEGINQRTMMSTYIFRLLVPLALLLLLNQPADFSQTMCWICNSVRNIADCSPTNGTHTHSFLESNGTYLCSANITDSDCHIRDCPHHSHHCAVLYQLDRFLEEWIFSSDCSATNFTPMCNFLPIPLETSLSLTCSAGVNCDNRMCTDVEHYASIFTLVRIEDATLPPRITTDISVETTPLEDITTPPPPQRDYTFIIITVPILAVIALVTIIVGVSIIMYKCQKKLRIPVALMTSETSFSEPIAQEWQLLERIGHGRYGQVYRAHYEDKVVAIKIFTSQGRSAWETERNLYSMESTAHKNILEFITCEVHGSGITRERALITCFYPLGSLNNHLNTHILSWQQACLAIHSISRGLAHLHSEYYTNSAGIVAEKYPVAHRDIKSANVLVRSENGDCVISDLGFALILDGKQASNTVQAGTYRYMAPEALDARMNLHDFQSFKQIDVYALALVMWEIMSRTCVLTEEEVPSYQLPYKEEAGSRPTLERLKDIVAIKKLRPSLPTIWGNHEHLSFLQETVYECWDDDAEARLSAANVTIRMEQLMETNIDDITRQDGTSVTTVTASVTTDTVTVIDTHRPTEHSESSPPPYYSRTDPIPLQQSDVPSLQIPVQPPSEVIITERPSEHSQSSPPPYDGLVDYIPFQHNPFPFNRGPVPRHQISMPHISVEGESSRNVRGHMTARCTLSLRSSYHCEQEMRELNNFNKNESLSLRNVTNFAAAQEESNEEEVARKLRQSSPGYERPEGCRLDQLSFDESGIHESHEVDADSIVLNEASHLNSDSGILDTNSDSARENSLGDSSCPSLNSEQKALTNSVDGEVHTSSHGKMSYNGKPERTLQTENSGNSESTVTGV